MMTIILSLMTIEDHSTVPDATNFEENLCNVLQCFAMFCELVIKLQLHENGCLFDKKKNIYIYIYKSLSTSTNQI